MMISRKEAITFASFLKMFTLSKKEIAGVLESARAEKEIANETELTDTGFILRTYIEHEFDLYTNEYIEGLVFDKSKFTLKISDPDIELFSCPCCGYKTLNETGDWSICRVCYWEDDGIYDENISGPNKMTLKEAKLNFQKYGAIEQRFLTNLHPERMRQYSRGY